MHTWQKQLFHTPKLIMDIWNTEATKLARDLHADGGNNGGHKDPDDPDNNDDPLPEEDDNDGS